MPIRSTFIALLLIFIRQAAPGSQPAASSSRTNLVVNGSFEIPMLALGSNYVVPDDQLLPWQTTEQAFLIWASPLPNELAADGRQHLEVVTVWQIVLTTVGEDYNFRFYHAARPGVDSTLSVEINGQVIRTFAENGAALAGFIWQRFSTNFTATTNATTIRFNGVGVAGNAHIDNVALERLPQRSVIRVSEVELCWETVTNRVYQVQHRSALTGDVWIPLGSTTQGNGTTQCINDPVPADEPRRFYRVITVP